MYVEIESADANDPVDVLIVTNGSGATILLQTFQYLVKSARRSDEHTPTTVDLNVLE